MKPILTNHSLVSWGGASRKNGREENGERSFMRAVLPRCVSALVFRASFPCCAQLSKGLKEAKTCFKRTSDYFETLFQADASSGAENRVFYLTFQLTVTQWKSQFIKNKFLSREAFL